MEINIEEQESKGLICEKENEAKDASELMRKITDSYKNCMLDLMTDDLLLLDSIKNRSLKSLMGDLEKEIEFINVILQEDSDYDPVDLQNPIIFLGIHCVCLFERMNRDAVNYREKKEQEIEREKDLKDLDSEVNF